MFLGIREVIVDGPQMCMCVCSVCDFPWFRSGGSRFQHFGAFTARSCNMSLFVTDEASALSNMILSFLRGQSACVHHVWIRIVRACSERIFSKFQSLFLSCVSSMLCFYRFSSLEVKIKLGSPIIPSLNCGRNLFKFSDFPCKSRVYSHREPFNKREIFLETTS